MFSLSLFSTLAFGAKTKICMIDLTSLSGGTAVKVDCDNIDYGGTTLETTLFRKAVELTSQVDIGDINQLSVLAIRFLESTPTNVSGVVYAAKLRSQSSHTGGLDGIRLIFEFNAP
ncbi:MAG: hypothetical protein NTV34_17390 [Proteobacteria bacterium]|nr:hypothetical protein [Pseudomonadota bacterium]